MIYIYPLGSKLLYYYTDTVEIILHYECECVLRDKYMEMCLGGCEGVYKSAYLSGDVGGGLTEGLHIHMYM